MDERRERLESPEAWSLEPGACSLAVTGFGEVCISPALLD